MKKLIFIMGLLLALTGCAIVSSTDVQKIGKGRYSVTANMLGVKVYGMDNSNRTRNKAVDDANAFCLNSGYRYAAITNEEIERNEKATATIYFRCAGKI
ncbi:MAG: hypothetical protein OQK77_08310 [Psychromonas sp.]|nr:hypothetical protein [Psychromonas sp.]